MPEPGRYLAAAMLVTVQPVNHANVLPAEEVLLFKCQVPVGLKFFWLLSESLQHL